MLRIAKIAGLCLASMLVMGMALAGTASATELLWLVCLKGTGLTRYTNSRCLEAGAGEWQSLGVPAGTTITVKLLVISILLRDTKLKAAVNCFNKGSRGEGVIEAGGKGKVTVAEYENPGVNCVSVEGCEKGTVEEVKGINLPWKTEIFKGANGNPLTRIAAGNNEGKEPGWKLKCKVAGVKNTDECESAKGKEEELELESEVTTNPEKIGELLVRAEFQQRGEINCSIGGANTGKVLGLIAILLPGGALSITTSP
jgi:hypothetical protein